MPTLQSARREFIGAFAAGSIVVVFCFILLWHDPEVFWNDDYQLSILPVFADVARSWNEGDFPLLSPYSWVCGNLAGEFEYGTFSVFVNAAVVLIWKLPLTFSQQAAALSMTHLFVLAVGAFLLARDKALSIPLAVFAALVAALNGWIICWGATDWFGALGAFTWLPWAWWGLERALDPGRTRYRFLWPAPFVYLLVTGGFPYTVLMLLLLIAWLSIRSLVQMRSIQAILPMLLGATLGFAFSAPAWLALLEYVHGSAREMQSANQHFQWLVPPAAWPGLILPAWTVNWVDFYSRHIPHTATELACGLVAPAALVTGFIWHPRALARRLKWELILLLLVFVLAMLPTVGLFRWSFRWLPFFHLILAICGSQVLQLRPRLPTAAAAMLMLIVVVLAMSILGTAGPYGAAMAWILLMISAVWMFTEIFLPRLAFHGWAPAGVTFLALLATYLCLPTNCGVPKFKFSQGLVNPAPLDPERLYLSIYPPPETDYRVEKRPEPIGQIVRPGSTSMWAGLRFINGYSPIRPAGVAREFQSAVHGEIDLEVARHLLSEQSGPNGKLALLGVDGIVIAQEVTGDPQPPTEWEPVMSTAEGRVFHRRGSPFDRVRSLPAIDSRPGEQFSVATISNIAESRNRVEANVEVPPGARPALLIFSRPYFRGYKASINDKKLAVETENGLCPVVRVPAGSRGRLTLEYRPFWVGGGFL